VKSLDTKLLKKFLEVASQRLKGEWLLVGGTLLPAVGVQVRATIDIDLVGLGKEETAQNLELMDVADSLGLPVDAINQAAAFFVEKAGYKKSDLIPLKKGKHCKIYRPSVLLFWRLKLARLSEADALDCQHYLAYCRGQEDDVEVSALSQEIARRLKLGGSPEYVSHLENLRKSL
jgi:hypothetical protein